MSAAGKVVKGFGAAAEFAQKAYNELLDFVGYNPTAGDIEAALPELSKETRNIVKALQRDDYLGFDTPDKALAEIINRPDETIANFDISPQLKSALTKNAYTPKKPKNTIDDVNFPIGGTEKLSSGMEYDLSNAQKTQVSNTGGTYQKARNLLDSLGVGDDVLDYGAGKGHGTPILRGKSYEPFPNQWEPDFTGLTPPDQEFEGVVNLNVLNVLPPEMRQEVAQGVLNAIKKDGYGVVGARGYADVMSAKNKTPTGDGGIITGRDTYQYGFGGENEGLVDFLQRMAKTMPEKEFVITPVKGIANTGAKIKRLKSGALPTAGAGILGQILSGDEDLY